jgi:glycosyltransferase involved in cell wall biosynthesis
MSAAVSIVMPAYQAQATVARALHSLRAQSFSDWEAIVVDDGSSDRTAEIAAKLAAKDSRIRLIACANGGAAAARNRGIAAATGEWLVFLDADDTLDPAYLKRMQAALAAAPDCDAVVCGYQRRDPSGKRTMISPAPDLDQNAFSTIGRSPPGVIHGIMLRRRLVIEVGCFDPALRTNEDWDLWARIGRLGT